MTIAQNSAYILYSDGSLLRVDLGSLSCVQTPFDPGSVGFPGNVGLATAPSGDALIIYGCLHAGSAGCNPALANYNLTTFTLSDVKLISPSPSPGYPVDVKSSAYGQLFACNQVGILFEVDPATAVLLGTDRTNVVVGNDLAVLTFNDQLYLLSQDVGLVSRYDLALKVATGLGTLGFPVVGAGAAPCLSGE
jgi:hypothetical protein